MTISKLAAIVGALIDAPGSPVTVTDLSKKTCSSNATAPQRYTVPLTATASTAACTELKPGESQLLLVLLGPTAECET